MIDRETFIMLRYIMAIEEYQQDTVAYKKIIPFLNKCRPNPEHLMRLYVEEHPGSSGASAQDTFTKNEGLILQILSTNPSFRYNIRKEAVPALLQQSKVYRQGMLTDDPYFRHIRVPEVSYCGYQLQIAEQEAWVPFIYDLPYTDKNGIQIPRIAVADHPLHYPQLLVDDDVRCAVSPFAVSTMAPHIQAAHGHVLVHGLDDLGYFACLCAEKPEVTHITITETDSTILSLFTKYILPQFPNRNKVTVEERSPNANPYKSMLGGKYDYCLIVELPGDGEACRYLLWKRLEQKHPIPRTTIAYWQEHAFISLFMDYVFSAIHVLVLENAYPGKNIIREYFDHLPGREALTRDFFYCLLAEAGLDTLDDVRPYIEDPAYTMQEIQRLITAAPKEFLNDLTDLAAW